MKRGWTRSVVVAALALTIWGCSNPFGSPNGPEIGVSLAVPRDVELPSSVLHVRISGRRVRLDAPPSGEGASTRIRGYRYGEGPVAVTLIAGDDTIAHGEFSVELKRDHDHWVDADIGRHRPAGFCFGEAAALPLRGSATDTMFVTYGSLPNGAIC